ncbi:MAG TPA: tetratricopeptide repeat protein [Ferruginibacter sp.]|nr:tetratricopeptide repeat protein [Ferruginibacter sp.]HMP21989.1 tetratricopeptide repeat protein [Ferruginibacter sp.]
MHFFNLLSRLILLAGFVLANICEAASQTPITFDPISKTFKVDVFEQARRNPTLDRKQQAITSERQPTPAELAADKRGAADEERRKAAEASEHALQVNTLGMAQYSAGNYHAASLLFRQAAERGFPGAWYNLGMIHYQGLGTTVNFDSAYKFYLKGHVFGSCQATYALAHLYLSGLGVKQDSAKAAYYFRQATQGAVPEDINNKSRLWLEKLRNSPNPEVRFYTHFDYYTPVPDIPGYYYICKGSVDPAFRNINIMNDMWEVLLPSNNTPVRLFGNKLIIQGYPNGGKFSLWKLEKSKAEPFANRSFESAFFDVGTGYLFAKVENEPTTFIFDTNGIVFNQPGKMVYPIRINSETFLEINDDDSFSIVNRNFKPFFGPLRGKRTWIEANGVVFTNGNKMGVAAWNGKIILHPEYDVVDSIQSGLRIVGIKQNPSEKLRMYESHGKTSITKRYITNMLWGIKDSLGKDLLPVKYSKIEFLQGGLIAAAILEKPSGSILEYDRYGIYTAEGELLLPHKYAVFKGKTTAIDEYLLYDQNQKRWIFNTTNRTLRKAKLTDH